jgi:hypothetical protein
VSVHYKDCNRFAEHHAEQHALVEGNCFALYVNDGSIHFHPRNNCFALYVTTTVRYTQRSHIFLSNDAFLSVHYKDCNIGLLLSIMLSSML